MAAPCEEPVAFASWLDGRLEALGIDRDVYNAYIQGVLREEESEDEKLDALQSILAAFLEEDSLEMACKEIVAKWYDTMKTAGSKGKQEDEIQAIANMIEKQAQIVVKPKEVSEEEKQRRAAVLAQYANVTDEEEYPFLTASCLESSLILNTGEDEDTGTTAAISAFNSNNSLFKNTNLEDIVNARKLERDALREGAQRKKEQDKLQREKDKLAKQERKEKEKKRTQKGERKR
uniref:Coiled-coil domain-containing protein 43 n=1 Tax=Geotrypetes seraphini TaxID=260995 RepID=A0A6P8PCG0_GEOSA|nr:coiled-coil domain-containing protein 43 isoform X1 [Geotrypetes seraphini]